MSYYIRSHYASQHAFLAILTHNPLHSGRYVTLTEPLESTDVSFCRCADQ